MQPKLVDELVSASGSSAVVSPVSLRRVMSTETASEITDAMVRAVNGPFSPPYAGGARVPGALTAGKSGSAELGTGQRPHSWFIGFAPADRPKIAVAIVVERGGAGSQRAVPMGGDLIGLYLKLRGD
jgi:peptidoglycan glycosyltransferase